MTKFFVKIDGSQRLTRRNRRFLNLYNSISTNIDAKAFCGWRQDQPSSEEENVSLQCFQIIRMMPELMRQIKLMGIIRMLSKSTILLLWFP